MTDFWLRLTSLLTLFSLALLSAAVFVGQGMEKRVLAVLSMPEKEGWQIHLLEVDRGIQHALTRDINRYGFMWSLDGQEIGFSSRETGFTVMDWTGHNRRPMADSDGWMMQFAKGLSSFDSEWNASKTERLLTSYYEIYICDIDCTQRKQLTNDGSYHDASPAWSSDGHRILFISDRVGVFLEIFVMNRDGTSIQQLTHNSRAHNWNPHWSPDSRQIAFVVSLGTNGEVFIMDEDGKNSRRITYNHMNDAYPAWQP